MRETLYGLTVVSGRRRCTLCRTEVPAGLVGAIRTPSQPYKALCESCLNQQCETLGLALQGIRLMRETAAYGLGKFVEADELAGRLLQFSFTFERRVRSTWLRQHPTAKVDCVHCLLEAFPDLDPLDAKVLRAAFRTYQRLRFENQTHREIFIIRLLDFGDYSEDQKIEAIGRLDLFLTTTDDDDLCPLVSDLTPTLQELPRSVPSPKSETSVH